MYIYDHHSGRGNISFVALMCVSQICYNQNSKILTYYQRTTGVLLYYPLCPVGLFVVLRFFMVLQYTGHAQSWRGGEEEQEA